MITQEKRTRYRLYVGLSQTTLTNVAPGDSGWKDAIWAALDSGFGANNFLLTLTPNWSPENSAILIEYFSPAGENHDAIVAETAAAVLAIVLPNAENSPDDLYVRYTQEKVTVNTVVPEEV